MIFAVIFVNCGLYYNQIVSTIGILRLLQQVQKLKGRDKLRALQSLPYLYFWINSNPGQQFHVHSKDNVHI